MLILCYYVKRFTMSYLSKLANAKVYQMEIVSILSLANALYALYIGSKAGYKLLAQ